MCVSAMIPDKFANASHLVLPGQGAIGTWFTQLKSDAALRAAVLSRLEEGPVLGICLGLQALFERSEENNGIEGLGQFPGVVRHFATHPAHSYATDVTKGEQNVEQAVQHLKVPHMGWNQVKIRQPHPLWQSIDDMERFYFVHSYFVQCDSPEYILGECEYGNVFTAAAGCNNIFATQFHPEKSQDAGLKLLNNFLNWNGKV